MAQPTGQAGEQQVEDNMRVIVAEDAPLLREGIAGVLTRAGIDVVAMAVDADDLSRKTRAHHPDVIVVDIRMPPTNTDDGLRAALALRASNPVLGVLVLSQYLETVYARELFEGGTAGTGYLLKDRVGDIDSFVESVRRVGQGGSVLDPEVVALLMGRHHPATPVRNLTDRERTVVALMAQGCSNLAIATSLHLSQASVEKHIRNIFTKLELPNAPDTHRRVLTVLAYLETAAGTPQATPHQFGP
jgi:DNA-binding NarL/FixJ family response regulator